MHLHLLYCLDTDVSVNIWKSQNPTWQFQMEKKMFQTEINQHTVDILYSVWSLEAMKWQTSAKHIISTTREHCWLGHV